MLVIRKVDDIIVAVVADAAEIEQVNEHVISIEGRIYGGDGGFDVVKHDAGDEAVGCRFEDGEIVPLPVEPVPVPEPEPIEDVRKRMLADVNLRCEMMLGALKAGYPDGEVVSWDQQVIEARALDVSPTAVTPLLSAIAAQRGIDVTTLAGRVLEKANAYAVASGSIIGARQRLEDAINAANTVEALSAINTEWPT